MVVSFVSFPLFHGHDSSRGFGTLRSQSGLLCDKDLTQGTLKVPAECRLMSLLISFVGIRQQHGVSNKGLGKMRKLLGKD